VITEWMAAGFTRRANNAFVMAAHSFATTFASNLQTSRAELFESRCAFIAINTTISISSEVGVSLLNRGVLEPSIHFTILRLNDTGQGRLLISNKHYYKLSYLSQSKTYYFPSHHPINSLNARDGVASPCLPEFHVTIKSLFARVMPTYNRRRRSLT